MGSGACGNGRDAPFTPGFAPDAQRANARLRDLVVDATTFDRRVSRCDLSVCQGLCCYDGVYLRPEEAERIPALAREHAGYFSSLGLGLPEEVVIEEDNGTGRPAVHKTATRDRPGIRAAVADFPDHFEETACVFMVDDGRCSLQLLSAELGYHPWHYKPVACWLHPILTKGNRDRGWTLMLPDEETDPDAGPDQPGFTCFTMCGRTDPAGAPAAEVLEDELRCLGDWIGRDLLAEVRRQP